MNHRFKLLIVTSSTALVVLLLIGSLLGQSASPEDPYRHIAVYSEVLSKIKSDYVEEPDLKGVTLGALNGLLEAIDPFASFLSAEQYKQYLKNKGSYKGDVGLVLAKRYGYITVLGVLSGSPGAKAGMAPGDVLETIKAVTTRDMPLAYADLLLRGDPATTVELSVLRFRRAEPQKITLTRDVIRPAPVTSKMLADQIAYVQVQSLDDGQSKQVAAAVTEMQRQGAKRLIVDLRGNATGTPEEGMRLANLFVEKGLLTYVQGQKVSRQNFEADPAQVASRLPLAVIVNRGTGGGAEIASAALLDNKRAEVVGERTFGDAAQRKAILMKDGAAVILSVAKFYMPSGKAIQDQGVAPSVAMVETEPPSDSDDDPDRPQPERKPAEDALLKKAIEVVTKGVQRVAAAPERKRDVADPTLGPLNVPRAVVPR